MKTTLAALVLLQLVVLSESWRFEESQETHSKMVSQRFTIQDLQENIKTCSRNPKLESMRKTLSLATVAEHGRQRQKRSVRKYKWILIFNRFHISHSLQNVSCRKCNLLTLVCALARNMAILINDTVTTLK